MDCLFCKIVARDVPAEIVYEDDNTVAFLDIQPRALGHTMVIPKTHAETILDLPDDLIHSLFGAVKTMTGALREALQPDGFTIGINQGKKAGQAIDHLHVHIIPRFEGDGGGSIHSVVSSEPKESLSEVAEKIKKVL